MTKKTVMGVHAPPPRILRPVIHRTALRYGVPFVMIMFGIDAVIWWAG